MQLNFIAIVIYISDDMILNGLPMKFLFFKLKKLALDISEYRSNKILPCRTKSGSLFSVGIDGGYSIIAHY